MLLLSLTPVACKAGGPTYLYYSAHWRPSSGIGAFEAVSSGELSIRRAAEQFDVPKSTMHDRVSGGVQAGAHSGPPRYTS